jgi:hypothetical protein
MTVQKQQDLKIKKPNALDFYGLRQPKDAPMHFEYISVPIQYNLENTIKRWISIHLKGRFYVGKTAIFTKNNKIEEYLQIGFEDSKELSYFSLACPHLKYN